MTKGTTGPAVGAGAGSGALVFIACYFVLPRSGTLTLLLTVALAIAAGAAVGFAVKRSGSTSRATNYGAVPGDFYLQRMGKEVGPLAFAQIASEAQEGTIAGTTMVRADDSDWFPASEMRPAIFSSRSWLTALLLSVFVGGLGIDRFYLGRVATGILKLVTLGGLGIWALVDLILIATNRLRDRDGLRLAR